MPIYIDVYLTAHSSLATTPSYARSNSKWKKYADGVLIYTHPNPVIDSEKYQIVKAEFANTTNDTTIFTMKHHKIANNQILSSIRFFFFIG